MASAGVGRNLVIGEDPNRITARLTGLDVEPSEVLDVLDPTAVDADLADTLRLPGSIGDLVAPWREEQTLRRGPPGRSPGRCSTPDRVATSLRRACGSGWRTYGAPIGPRRG